jgi:Protein of unknown function (DUF2867)
MNGAERGANTPLIQTSKGPQSLSRPELQYFRAPQTHMDGSLRMRLPNTAHNSRPWRIHELTRYFWLEDVWALPTPGGSDDFPRLLRLMASGDRSQGGSSRVASTFWALRWKVGELLGWDSLDAGHGFRVPTLRDRLPADLRDASSGPDFDALLEGRTARPRCPLCPPR